MRIAEVHVVVLDSAPRAFIVSAIAGLLLSISLLNLYGWNSTRFLGREA